MGKSDSTILGFFAGAVSGVVVGLLLAPDKGSNTRDKLTFQFDKLRKNMEMRIDELFVHKNLEENLAKEESIKVIQNVKEKAEYIKEAIRDDFNELISQIKNQD